MKKLLSLVAIFVVIFAAGCSQSSPTSDTSNPDTIEETDLSEEEMTGLVDSVPEDFVGVWQRTGTYVDGALKGKDPALWTLNNTNYTSTGSCINAGKVMYEGDNKMTITLDSTTCPNVSTGLTISYIYELQYDEERDVEVMTVWTGPVMETYDRQS